MSSHSGRFLNKRVLKLNVGFLLSDGPGTIRDIKLNIPSPIKVADDLILNFVSGELRLSRTKEGILVQGPMQTAIDSECSRCLDSTSRNITFDIEELFAHPNPTTAEFAVNSAGDLDLAPLVWAEVVIKTAQPALCQPDCRGICLICGINRNLEHCHCDTERIDPRLAKLSELLDAAD